MAGQPYPFNQRPAPTAVLAQTFEGSPGGMNLALPPHEIADTEARILVDWLLDQPGITRQRGPVADATGIPHLPRQGSGLFATLNPQGVAKFAALTGNGSNGFFSVLKDDNSAWVDIAWPFNFTAAPPYFIVDAKPAVGGGLIIGASSDYGVVSNQGLAYWFGGTKPNYAAASVTVARGSTTVTAPSGFVANVVPGMFLFANTDDPYTNAYIGCVLSVNSDTSLTLAAPSPFGATAKAGTFQSIRGIAPQVTTGEITCSTGSTAVTGGSTKFISQGVGTGIWQLYRQRDGAFIGNVSAVNSEISITLAANAAISLSSENYVAIRADADYSISNPTSTQKVGFLTASYADRQWYANKGSDFTSTAKVWFSDAEALEALDLSSFDGNWFEIVNTSSVNEPIRAIAAAYNGLLIFKETEAFIVGGNSPDSFEVNKLEDDGTLCAMSVQEYGGGVIWAGREGINFYDGVQVTNLVEASLGHAWKDTIRTLDPTTYRLWSMIDRDHYFLFLESVAPPFSIIKGNTSSSFTRMTVVINMLTRSVVLATNMDLRGSAIVPATATRHAYFLVNGSDGFGHVCDGDTLFVSAGVDSITCTGNSLGPSVYIESKKFDAGDGMRLKRWKQVAMNYLVGGGDLVIDIVLGLNDVGQVANTTFPQSVYTWSSLAQNIKTWTDLKQQYTTWSQVIQSVFIPARIRMQKKSQFLSFRIYGSVQNLTNAEIGPFQLAYKFQRVGRI